VFASGKVHDTLPCFVVDGRSAIESPRDGRYGHTCSTGNVFQAGCLVFVLCHFYLNHQTIAVAQSSNPAAPRRTSMSGRCHMNQPFPCRFCRLFAIATSGAVLASGFATDNKGGCGGHHQDGGSVQEMDIEITQEVSRKEEEGGSIPEHQRGPGPARSCTAPEEAENEERDNGRRGVGENGLQILPDRPEMFDLGSPDN
jgi:hypothetical protein